MFLNLLKEKLTHFYKVEGGQPEFYQSIHVTFKVVLKLKLGSSSAARGKTPFLCSERQE